MTAARQVGFGLLIEPTGDAYNGWLAPEQPRNAAIDLPFITVLVQEAERALFRFAFVADSVSIEPGAKPYYLNRFEPITLLSALAPQTSNIGLVATMSASYTEAFNVARQIASIDLMSGGRAGINVVTTAWESAAANFGDAPLIAHDERYRRADEYVEVLRGLWDSYEDDAFPLDRETRRFLDASKQHRLDFEGEFLSVRGPLNIQRSPQGQPVIFQAGSSPVGRDFAARNASAIFAKETTLEGAKAYTSDIKARAAAAGRDPDEVHVYMGAHLITAPTVAEAEDKYERILGYVSDDEALRWMSFFYDYFDFSGYDLDGPFPDISTKDGNHFQGMTASWEQRARDEGLTLRQVARLAATPREDFFGTPEMVADAIEHWVDEGAADGFLLNNWTQPSGLRDVTTLVVPELQRRGRYPTEYASTTLRGNLELPVPPNRYTAARAARQS